MGSLIFTSDPAVPALKATRARSGVVGLMVALGMITYLDRACIATLAPNISAEFSLSKVQMGYVFSAFALSYAAFEVPTAWLADRMGVRKVLTRIVLWWSAFTIGTGLATGFSSLVAVRFCFGAGEAGSWGCMGRTFRQWIPRAERGKVQGMFFAGAHLAGGLSPLLVALLVRFLPWRAVFFCFGSIGLIWAAVWHGWFRDRPAEHPGVNAAELAEIEGELDAPGTIPAPASGSRVWSLNLAALCIMYVPNSCMSYFCLTWLPTYLKERFGLAEAELVFFSGLPLCLSVVADLTGGWATDRLSRRFGVRAGRCGLGGAAYVVAAVAVLAVPYAKSGMAAGALISVATGAVMFTLAAAWCTCIELSPTRPAVVGAVMNTAGQTGGLLSPLVVAYTLKWFGSWNVSINLLGAMLVLGVLAWWVIRPPDASAS